jgi:uncharacterized membrane protein (UPF0136 family)
MKYYDYFALFGLVTLVLAGIAGVKAKSRASLFAGGVSAMLLLTATMMELTRERRGGDGIHWGYIIGTVASVALLGRFLPALLKTKKFYPAGIMVLLAVPGLAAGILGAMNAGPLKVTAENSPRPAASTP